ncbi:MAG: phosphoheptose isomerase [bacterium]
MQTPEQRIAQHFTESIAVKRQTLITLRPLIALAADKLFTALVQDNKILSCGNGGSAGDAMHFASELVNRFETERQGLAAIALTADTLSLTSIANDYAYDRVFARQVEALGQAGDVLLAISTSGNSANVLEAIRSAHQAGMVVIALSGKQGGKLRALLHERDIELCVSSNSTARIQEVHLLLIHCLCDLLDVRLSAPQGSAYS